MSGKPGKPRRYKLKCMLCESVFNNDYKRQHELKIHNGKSVKVKTVGTPDNPFSAAKRQNATEVGQNVFDKPSIPEGLTRH